MRNQFISPAFNLFPQHYEKGNNAYLHLCCLSSTVDIAYKHKDKSFNQNEINIRMYCS